MAHAHPGPLVDPAPRLSRAQLARAERQIVLPGFGAEAQRRLAAARVLVIGAGGLGSACIPYLVGAGVGAGERADGRPGGIGIIDDDVVELSNLHRQIAHGAVDIGRSKVDSIIETARAIDPDAQIEPHALRLTSRNAIELFADYDLVIDGSDNFPTRYLANDAAQLTGTPLVWGAILQYHGQVGVAWHAHGPGYRDLFPAPPAPEDVLDCGTGGVLPGLCGTVGSLLATEAMKLIAGLGEPLIGRVLLYDALAARTRELDVRRDPSAESVTELIDYEVFCGIGAGGGAGAGSDAGATAADAGATEDPAALAAVAVDAAVFADELREGRPVRLIDVRTPEERGLRSISGSESVPLADIEAGRVPDFGDGVLTLHCERDPRSIRAAALIRESLAAQGSAVPEIRYLSGGIRAFAATAPELLEGAS
ncbi:ThiF family adenylyltransferase [Leucobacter sp. GX24907]